jgi:predicted transcriptional regulator
MHDRALKIALIFSFCNIIYQYFNKEIEALLVDDVFKQLCVKEVDGLKIVCDIIEEHELNLNSKPIQKLIVTNDLQKMIRLIYKNQTRFYYQW